jgi:hypothetical protein
MTVANPFRVSPEVMWDAVPVPMLVGIGPHVFSTSLALERWPSIIWDVDAYYAELGVDPHASKTDIKRAYQRHQADGTDTPRITFIVKQLLNETIRRDYDACRFNTLFYDRYLDKAFRDAVRQEAHDKGEMEEAQPHSLETDEEGLNYQVGGVDTDEVGEVSSDPNRKWEWGFFLWHTAIPNVALVRRWQQCVYQALLGRPISLSVGLMGGSLPVQLVEVEGTRVAFINEQATPTIPLAKALLSHLVDTE